jgi:hypothetical protein
MSLRERARKKLSATTADLDRARLQDRYKGVDFTHIDECPRRVPVRIGGEVQGIKVVPRAGSSTLEVTVADGTGKAIAVFLGRKQLPGVSPGRTVMFEGVGRVEAGRTILLNPAYTILPS